MTISHTSSISPVQTSSNTSSRLPSVKSSALPKKYLSNTLLYLWDIEDKTTGKKLTPEQHTSLTNHAKLKLQEKIFKDLKTIIKKNTSNNIFIPEYDFSNLGPLKDDFENIFVESLMKSITYIKSQEIFQSKQFILTNKDNFQDTNLQKLRGLNEQLGEKSLALHPDRLNSIAKRHPGHTFPEDKIESYKLIRQLQQQPEQSVKVGCCGLFRRLVKGRQPEGPQISSQLAFNATHSRTL